MNKNLGTLPVYNNEFDRLIDMTLTGELKSADGIEVVDPKFPFIKHYFTYALTDDYGYTWFFAAYSGIDEVKLLREDNLANLADKYKLGKTIPFQGSNYERTIAIKRGHELVGKKYYWVGRNCENVMNYIQTGRSISNQTRGISAGFMATGLVVAASSKNKNVRTIASVVSVAALIALLIDLFGENNP